MKLETPVLSTLLFIFFVVTATTVQASSKVVIEYFYLDISKICSDCPWPDSETLRVNEILGTIGREYGEQVLVDSYDININQYWDLFSGQYNLTRWPAVVVNATYSLEREEITLTELKGIIDSCLKDEEPTKSDDNFLLTGSLALSLGLFSGFSPCLMAMLAFLLTYTTGTTASMRSGVKKSLIFGLGFVAAALLLGGFLIELGAFSSFANYLSGFTLASSLILIIAGLTVIGLFELPFSTTPLVQKLAKKYSINIWGLFILGVVFFFAKILCAAPLYLILLANVVLNVTIAQSLLFFLLFGAGLLMPFLAVGIIGGGAPRLAKRIRGRHRLKIRFISGLILIAYGVWLFLWVVIL